MRRLVLLLALCACVLSPALAQEPVHEDAVALIRAHALDSSRVMAHLAMLTDVHGPRLTGSPGLDAASDWAIEQFRAWGVPRVEREAWGPFGRGWESRRFSLQAVAPVAFPLLAYPKAWSPGIDGVHEAPVVIFDAEDEADFDRFRGRLEGAIVLLEEPRDVEEFWEPVARRHDAERLLELANVVDARRPDRVFSPEAMRRRQLAEARLRFLVDQGPLLVLDRSRSRGDYGSVYVAGADVPTAHGQALGTRARPWDLEVRTVPQATVASEHYNRLYRLAERGLPVRLRAEMDVAFYDDDPMEYNVLADLPGTDPAVGDEIVMLGAHLDSWHAGTGATDNGAGSAVVMEAIRILTRVYDALGRSPRRTIRAALWTGEEQGLHGSLAHVNARYATLESWSEPPTAIGPEHERLSGYFNLDNGTGKIRGIYLQGNDALRPIFGAWLQPFADLGAETLSLGTTGSTDHVPFDLAGLPGFQFIQDPIAYGRTHHSNMDVLDHAQADDLAQAAAVMAAFVFHTAERDDRLPRKPLVLAEPAPAEAGR